MDIGLKTGKINGLSTAEIHGLDTDEILGLSTAEILGLSTDEILGLWYRRDPWIECKAHIPEAELLEFSKNFQTFSRVTYQTQFIKFDYPSYNFVTLMFLHLFRLSTNVGTDIECFPQQKLIISKCSTTVCVKQCTTQNYLPQF